MESLLLLVLNYVFTVRLKLDFTLQLFPCMALRSQPLSPIGLPTETYLQHPIHVILATVTSTRR
jgi:hypothetical protein